LPLSSNGSEAGVITKPSGGIANRVRPCIGYAALCGAVPDCGRAAVASSLLESLREVADVVDIWGAPPGQAAACDAVLAMDCASLVPEPYFLYLCPEQGNVAAADRTRYKRAAGLFTENSGLAQLLAEGAGIPREKIHVIPPAVAARQDSPPPQRPYLREAPRRNLLLCVSDCVGQRVNLKSVRLVLDVLEILRREHDSRISLTISGLENWPAGGPPPDGVTFRGAPPGAKPMALFDSHDLLVVPPGLCFDGLPEALSRGVPCVAACATEMSEAITPGVSGALMHDGNARELAAAVASVLANDDIYRSCFERAPAMAAYFSWERVARQVTRVISREIGLIP
jgi:glycosyltransferase involved in cell wall biosynthesis